MDVAALGLSVDSDGLVTGEKALDRFAEKADKAGGSADRLGASNSRSMAAIENMARQLDKITALLTSIDRATASSAASMAQQGAAAEQATRMNASLWTVSSKLTVNYTQMAPAATQAAAAVSAQGTAAASAAREVQQLDAHVQAYQTHLAAVGKSGAQFDSHVQAFRNLKQPVDDVGKSLKFTAVEGLNFSRQMADIGVTAASGMSPFLIALQQGPQLLDILQQKAAQTGATVGAAAKAAGAQIWAAVAPLAPIIAAVAVAAGGMAAAFALGAREINKSTGDISKGLGLTEKQLERVKKAGVDTGVTIGDTFFAFFDVVGDRLGEAFDGPLKQLKAAWNDALDFIVTYGNAAIKFIVGGFVGGVRAIAATWKLLPGAIADAINTVGNKAIEGIEWIIRKSLEGINWLIDQTNSILGTTFGHFDETVSLGRNKISGAGADFAAAFGKEFMSGIEDTGAAIDRFWSDVGKKARERREQAIREAAGDPGKTAKGPKTEGEKFADLVDDVNRQIAMIEAQTKALGLSDDAALRLTNQQKLLNDAQAKGITLTDAQRRALMGLADKLTQAQIALRKAQAIKEINEDYEKQIRALGQAAEQIGVYGKALIELVAYQEMLNKATNNGKDAIDALTDAQLRGKAATVAASTAANDNAQFMADLIRSTEESQKAMEAERHEVGLSGAALEAYRFEQEALAQARRQNIDLTPDQIAAIKATAEAYGEMRAEIDNLISRTEALMGVMGNIGGPLGDIFGVLTSKDPTAALLGMGGLGTLAGLFTKGGQEALLKQRDNMQIALERVLGPKATNIASGIADAFQGAGIGSMVGSTLYGNNKGANIGGAALGAVGMAVAGPIGAVIGSLVGSTIGKLASSTKRGGATFSGSGDSLGVGSNWGNSSSRIGASNDIAKAAVDALEAIGKSLGVAVGTFAGSVSVREGNLRYDPSGSGISKTSKGALNFGQDQEALLKAVISDAISDGVFQGLTEGEKRFLMVGQAAGGDIAKQLDRLAAYKAVSSDLLQAKDPQAFEMKALDDWKAAVIATATEIGASTAEIEELYGLRRAEIVEKYANAIVGTEAVLAERRELQIQLLVATGQAEQALAMVRADQLSAIDASNRALQEQVWAAQDAAQAAAELTNQLDRMSNLQIRLYQAQGNDNAALALQRQLELSKAASDAERALLQQIYAAEDAARTSSAAASSPSRETADNAAEQLLKQRQSMEIELLRLQGKETEALARQRQLELAALDPSLRALQQQIYAEQDLAKVREDAVKKVDNARAVLTKAYEAEASALQSTIDKFKGFSDSLRDFRASLFTGAGFDDYRTLWRRYQDTAAMARRGDEAGLRNLPGVAKEFLDAARGRAGSLSEFQLQVAQVAQDIDRAIGASDGVVDINQAQLEALDRIYTENGGIKEEVVSVRKAVEDLKQAIREMDNRQAEIGKAHISATNAQTTILADAADGVQPLTTQAA